MASESKISSQIAPIPYGGLIQNRTRPDGTLEPVLPGQRQLHAEHRAVADLQRRPRRRRRQAGFVHLKWRDLENGPRADSNINKQQRFIASLNGNLSGWDYEAAFSYNENKVSENLRGYSDGDIITAGVLNGMINPYGAQYAAGAALIASAALDGNVQNAKGTTTGVDFHASRELGDWMHAGRNAASPSAPKAVTRNSSSAANYDYASKVVASTGIDPDTRNEGSRSVYAGYAELNVPVTSTLDVTAAVRFDKYSDFGNTTNPKLGFRWQPAKPVLVRGSFSTGFRRRRCMKSTRPTPTPTRRSTTTRSTALAAPPRQVAGGHCASNSRSSPAATTT